MGTNRSEFKHIGVDPEDSFAVVNGSPSITKFAAWDIDTAGLVSEALPDESGKDDMHAHAPIVGKKSGSELPFKTYFSGLGSAATGPAAVTGIGEMLETAIGTEDLGTGDLSHSSPGTALEPVMDGSGAVIAAGGVVCGFVTPNFGVVWRLVDSVTVAAQDKLTLIYALPEAMAAGTQMYATASYQWLDTIPTSVQFEIGTESADNDYEVYGCNLSQLGLERTAPGELAKLSWTWKCATWVDDQAITLGAPSPDAKSPWMDAQAEIVPFGATAYDATYRRKLLGLDWTIDRGIGPDPDPHAADAVAGWLDGPGPAMTLNTTIRVDDQWRDDFRAGQTYTVMFTFSRTAGKASGVVIRKMVLMEDPVDTDENGQMALTLVLGVVSGSTAPTMVFWQG